MGKIFFFIFFIILTVVSCKKECKNTTKELTQDELSWVAYNGGEQLIFKRDNGTLDTIIVSNRNAFESVDFGEKGACDYIYKGISVNVFSKNYSWGGVSSVVSITASSQPRISFCPPGCSGINLNVTPQNNIIVNGNIYNNVYVVQQDTGTSGWAGSWRIFYTKANGIIRYDLTGGRYWEKIN